MADGVDWVSFGGATNIFIKGSGFSFDRTSNRIMLESKELGKTILAPLLTEEDAFNSNPVTGKLAYRLPSMPQLIGVGQEKFDQYYEMTFWLSVSTPDGVLTCAFRDNCKIKYRKA